MVFAIVLAAATLTPVAQSPTKNAFRHCRRFHLSINISHYTVSKCKAMQQWGMFSMPCQWSLSRRLCAGNVNVKCHFHCRQRHVATVITPLSPHSGQRAKKASCPVHAMFKFREELSASPVGEIGMLQRQQAGRE